MTVQALAGASLNVGSGSPEAFIEARSVAWTW
jgi:hypothetical protein